MASRVERAGGRDATRRAWAVGACCAAALVMFGQFPVAATSPRSRQEPAPAGCRVTGRVLVGAEPLPGAAVVVSAAGTVKVATSTGVDGKFTILFGPNATYHVTAELMAFTRAERDLTLGPVPCDTTLEFQLALRPREEPLAESGSPSGAAPATSPSPAGAQARRKSRAARRPDRPRPRQVARPARGAGDRGAAARARRPKPGSDSSNWPSKRTRAGVSPPTRRRPTRPATSPDFCPRVSACRMRRRTRWRSAVAPMR